MKHFFYYFMFSVIFLSNIFSQSLDPDKEITQYIHYVFDSKSGVKEVLDIIQDPTGFLWIATYDGLIRYDGNLFKVYNNSNREDLNITSARVLSIDADGRLWVGSNDNGIAILENNNFTMYNTENGLPNNSIRRLFTDSKNNTWIGTAAGLSLYKNGEFILFPKFSDLNHSQILFISEDKNNDIFVGTNGVNGLYLYKDGNFSNYYGIKELNDKKVEYIIPDKLTDDIWAVTSSTLFRIHNNTVIGTYNLNQHHKTDTVLFAQELFIDDKNALWITADGGLIRFYEEELSYYFRSNGLSDDLVKTIYQDYEGTMWVGTGKGLDKFVEPKFTVYSTEEGLINNGVNVIMEESEGKIWIGTNQGISIFDKQKKEFIENPAIKEIYDRIRHLYKDTSGSIWISTYGKGVAKYKNGKVIKWYNRDNGLVGNKARTVMEDSKGNIWVGTTTGVSIINDEEITNYSLKNGMSFEYVMCFMENSDGNIWIGTDGGGILIYNNGIFEKNITKADGLLGDIIFRFFKDDNGAIWITTGNGISKLENDKFTNFTSQDGLMSNAVFQILEDKNNKLWMTTTDGIFSIDSSEFTRDLRLEHKKLSLDIYDSFSGLRSGATATAWGIIDSEKHLWIPTYDGAAVFNPENNSVNNVPPKVVIDDEVLVDNKVYLSSDYHFMDPDSKRILFSFSALSFKIPEKVKIQYKLDGFDDDWSPLYSKREAEYTNLSPGEYSFLVRAYNNDGVQSTIHSTYSFNKEPHFYETNWFFIALIIIGLLLLTALFLMFNHFRLKVLKKQLARQQKELDLERKAKKAEQDARISEMKLTKSYSRFVPIEFLKLLNKDNIKNV